MKRSEFSKIVDEVCKAQFEYLQKQFKSEMHNGKLKLSDFAAVVISEMPIIAAKTTADILVQSGAVSLEDDS